MLKGKTIVLGVTGGIAAYKAAELTRELIRRGAAVKVIMTKSAAQFITPLTMQTLSCNPVYQELFSLTKDYDIAHVSLAEEADLVIVAPATANCLGKVAAGIADDLLTTVIMATRAPVLFCPSMNANMLASPAVQANMAVLCGRGYALLAPECGFLACKTEGAGRLPDAPVIADEAETILTEKDLAGQCILVTAGPTQEPFDPVRYITNYSSGKMGYAVARAAQRRGAEVILVSGPSSLPVPRGVEFVSVASARQMRDAVMEQLERATVIIKAAAVADYRPAECSDTKIKKRDGALTMVLERNPDIIAEIGRHKEQRVLVGFAMESHNLIENARAKLAEKNMDFIVANDVSEAGAGFQHDTNVIKILHRDGAIEDHPLMEKRDAADIILDRVKDVLARRGRPADG